MVAGGDDCEGDAVSPERRIFTRERWYNHPTVVAWILNALVITAMVALLG